MKKMISVLCVLLCLLCVLPMTAMASDEEQTEIPSELVGIWEGEGKPKNGGPTIQLHVRVMSDGSGEYSFDQGTYHESFPFTIAREGNRFSVDIPATSYLGKVEGTWELQDGTLLLDITSTFTSGGSYSYLAECKKTRAAQRIDAEYSWLSYVLKVDTVEIVPGSDLDKSPLSNIKDKTFAKVRLLGKDQQIVTKDLQENDKMLLFSMADTKGNNMPLYSVSYWNVGFDKEKGTFFTGDTQEGFFLYFLLDGDVGVDDLVLSVKAPQ